MTAHTELDSGMLTADHWLLIEGLLSDYQRRMLLDLRNGGLNETSAKNYRDDLAIAGEALAVIRGQS